MRLSLGNLHSAHDTWIHSWNYLRMLCDPCILNTAKSCTVISSGSHSPVTSRRYHCFFRLRVH
ncbi:hypothetical protein NECAME_00600 [Necator americanus]|uniref:Uncharacterized protein n=1 Tax=Necator americanus TaxID=51031 RepID=W2T0V1_NECAM|nr:hypothetical protein NECAME_00600 [Necator americanus]ETN75189.1 hypothetical protein NECAME_00600 [Necator americanus]